MFDKNEIKKDLYKSKAMATLLYYSHGKLQYKVDVLDGTYQFPIETVEVDYIEPFEEGEDEREIIKLSEDLGETKFETEIRGSELIRWITKAIDNQEFKKLV